MPSLRLHLKILTLKREFNWAKWVRSSVLMRTTLYWNSCKPLEKQTSSTLPNQAVLLIIWSASVGTSSTRTKVLICLSTRKLSLETILTSNSTTLSFLWTYSCICTDGNCLIIWSSPEEKLLSGKNRGSIMPWTTLPVVTLNSSLKICTRATKTNLRVKIR